MSKKIITTGATGFLGSHFLLWLARTRPSTVNALVRGDDIEVARQRMLRVVGDSAKSYRPTMDVQVPDQALNVVLGDIEQPRCKVSDEALAELVENGVDEFWHFAASLNFEERDKVAIRRQNLEGTRNAFELAQAAGVKRFIYISTAYTAGTLEGLIPEQLHHPEGFHNVYEETKCAAEHLITELCAEANLSLNIMRPSVVIGPAQTKRTGGSDSGLYGFIREIARLKRAMRSAEQTVRLFMRFDREVNFVPVDYMMRDVMSVIQSDFQCKPIVHLTSNQSLVTQDAVNCVFERLQIENLESAPDGAKDLSPLEELLAKRTEFYGSYLNSDKTFDRSLESHWTVDEDDFRAFVIEGISERRNQGINQLFKIERIHASDGTPLDIYDTGLRDSPCIVIVNAYGMPVEFCAPLAKYFSDKYRIVTWESRGIPCLNENFDDTRCDMDAHATDLETIVNHVRKSSANARLPVHILGWCTGAIVASKVAVRKEVDIDTLMLLNGSYHIQGVPETPFQSSMRSVMPRVAANRTNAKVFYKTIFQRTAGNGAANEDSDSTRTILSSTDSSLLHLTSIPFESPESLYRYGKLIAEFIKEDCTDWLTEIRQPTLVITGSQDITAHPEGSRRVAREIKSAKFIEYSDVDHFALYTSRQPQKDIREFLAAQPA